MTELESKVALVTGGDRGIGAGISLALAKAGADVAVNYHSRAELAEKICAEIKEIGRRAVAIQSDVSKSAPVPKMIASVERELGAVNILANNAGITRPQRIEEIIDEALDH